MKILLSFNLLCLLSIACERAPSGISADSPSAGLEWNFSHDNKAERVQWTKADGGDIKYFLDSGDILLTLPGRLPTVIHSWFAQAIMNEQKRIRMLRIMSMPGDAAHIYRIAENWVRIWGIVNLKNFDQFRDSDGKSLTGTVIDTWDMNKRVNLMLEIRHNIGREPFYTVLVVGFPQNYDRPEEYFASTQPFSN